MIINNFKYERLVMSLCLVKRLLFMLLICCFPCWRDPKCSHISRSLEIPLAGVLPGVFGKLPISMKRKIYIYIYILVYEIAIIIEYQRCIYHIEFHVAFCNSVCVRDPAVGLSNWLYSDSSKQLCHQRLLLQHHQFFYLNYLCVY